MVVDSSISDQLDLRNSGDGLEIRVKDRGLVISSLVVSMSIDFTGRIKRLNTSLVNESDLYLWD